MEEILMLFQKINTLSETVERIDKFLCQKNPKEPPKNLSIDDVIIILSDNGLTISKSKLYKLSSRKQIPFSKFGNKLIFEKKELFNWLESQKKSPVKSDEESIAMISSSAREKLTSKNTQYGKH